MTTTRVVLRVPTDAAVAGSIARLAAVRIGASAQVAAEVATAAAELATNVLRHGGGGHLAIDASPGVIELVARNSQPADTRVLEEKVLASLDDRQRVERGLGTLVRFMEEVSVTTTDGLATVHARRVIRRGDVAR